MILPFSKPSLDLKARQYLLECLESGNLAGDGPFTQRCHAFLVSHLRAASLLTHSCTAALEMSALLADIGPGDEVIMPSYTFVSTANAFVLRGATPVFVDVRPDTFNLDERLIEQAVTERTRAIVPVHYAGVACEMDAILAIAKARGLRVVEDAAQAYGAAYKGRPLGTLGDMGCLSFHATKNIVSGEGGALIVNDGRLLERAHIIREKGTNRTAYLNRAVDKYEWLEMGSSFLPSDLQAALLLAQLEAGEDIQRRRLAIWNRYHEAFAAAEAAERLRRPIVPPDCAMNGHIYYLVLPDTQRAQNLRAVLSNAGIVAQTHYVPLHSAPAGKRFGRTGSSMPVTDRAATTLIRLPMHAEMVLEDADRVAEIALGG